MRQCSLLILLYKQVVNKYSSVIKIYQNELLALILKTVPRDHVPVRTIASYLPLVFTNICRVVEQLSVALDLHCSILAIHLSFYSSTGFISVPVICHVHHTCSSKSKLTVSFETRSSILEPHESRVLSVAS